MSNPLLNIIYYIGAIALISLVLPIIFVIDIITLIKGKDPCADEKYGSML
jgi:hypothetical protein